MPRRARKIHEIRAICGSPAGPDGGSPADPDCQIWGFPAGFVNPAKLEKEFDEFAFFEAQNLIE
jgi:hypothetical protein